MAARPDTLSPARLCATHGLDEVDGARRLHARVIAEIVDAVAEQKGAAAAQHVRTAGLDYLHDVVDPLDVTPLRDRVLERLRDDLLRMAVNVGRTILGWDHEFYVDDYLILRVNLPYEIARKAPRAAENPGVGRVSPSVRAAAAARRVKDPLYDPTGYHRDHPPAAWAHGAHVDSWSGHSKDGVNVWWAMSDVPGEAGMVLYPEMTDAQLACDPRTLYLRTGSPLPPPTFVPLAAGEMLVFDPEILHGTHLNVTGRTRVAVSMRLNAHQPTFDAGCFYAREFWRRSGDVERGERERVLHFKREEHLGGAAAPPSAPPPGVRTIGVTPAGGAASVAVIPSSALREGERVAVDLPDGRVVVARTNGRLAAFDAACPHYGVDLCDGGTRGDTLYCPGCAVGFDLRTGRSACASLTLALRAARDEDGMVVIDLG